MTRIVVDSSLFSQLAAARGPVEVCNQQGIVLGTFQPLPVAEAWRNPPESPEELARRDQLTEGFTFAEMVACVEKRH
jgi:hypothetical protein